MGLRFAISAALAIGMSSPAMAQDATAEFVALWTEFIGFCGPALSAPQEVLANRQPRAGYDGHIYHSTDDQSAVSLQHFGVNENHYAELSLIRLGSTYTLYCDVSRYNDSPVYEGSIASVSETIRTVVAQSPGLAIAGGDFNLLPDSQFNAGIFGEDLEYHTTYVIDGAFPDFPLALSQLYIDPYGMYLVLANSWRAEP